MHRILTLLCVSVALPAQTARITILATADLHGHLLPYDYYTAKPANLGLAKIATLIERERALNPHALLFDCGDTIQGSPLEAVYQHSVRRNGTAVPPDPMMAAMNAAGFEAMVLGNHEFNYGLANLQRAREAARFPWLSANTVGGSRPFQPSIVKELAGVKVAIAGITTPSIPEWEKPEYYAGYKFLPGVDSARKAVAQLRSEQRADLVILGVHAGLEREGETPGEQMVGAIADGVPGVDAIVFGHTHQQVEQQLRSGVLLVQPKNWGASLARLDFELEKFGGTWKVVSKHSRLIPAGPDVPPDPRIVRIAAPYHEAAERYLNTPVAEAPVEMDARSARVRDTALIDSIQIVQLHYAAADVSFASSFSSSVRVKKGPVTVRELAALYLYDNELYAIDGTGRMVKDALENAARYFLTCQGDSCKQGPAFNREVFGFNYDMAQGVEYEIDLRRPAGDRVRNLRFRGQPLAADRKLRIAVNNYRAAGSAGYSMFRGARILWKSNQEIRDLMVEYYTRVKRLPESPDNNWRLVTE